MAVDINNEAADPRELIASVDGDARQIYGQLHGDGQNPEGVGVEREIIGWELASAAMARAGAAATYMPIHGVVESSFLCTAFGYSSIKCFLLLFAQV